MPLQHQFMQGKGFVMRVDRVEPPLVALVGTVLTLLGVAVLERHQVPALFEKERLKGGRAGPGLPGMSNPLATARRFCYLYSHR